MEQNNIENETIEWDRLLSDVSLRNLIIQLDLGIKKRLAQKQGQTDAE